MVGVHSFPLKTLLSFLNNQAISIDIGARCWANAIVYYVKNMTLKGIISFVQVYIHVRYIWLKYKMLKPKCKCIHVQMSVWFTKGGSVLPLSKIRVLLKTRGAGRFIITRKINIYKPKVLTGHLRFIAQCIFYTPTSNKLRDIYWFGSICYPVTQERLEIGSGYTYMYMERAWIISGLIMFSFPSGLLLGSYVRFVNWEKCEQYS